MTAPAPRKVGELASIQHLRGLAALSVAAYHALQWRGGGFDVGRAGVDVFFVISGVVMWTSTVGRGISPLAFLRRRAIRVVPPYWIATLVTAATAWLFPAFLPQVLRGTSHLLLSLAFIPHFDPLGRPFPTLPAGWSLDYEAMFYLVFAAALMTPESGRARLISVAMLVAVAIGLLAKDPVYQLGANPMLFQFAVGVWLGVAVAKRALPSRAAGLAMIVAAFALWGLVEGAGLFKEFWRPFQWGAPAALLVGGALSVERHGGWPAAALAHAPGRCVLLPLPLAPGGDRRRGARRRRAKPDVLSPGAGGRCRRGVGELRRDRTADPRRLQGQATIGGIELRMVSMLPPVFRPNIVPRS